MQCNIKIVQINFPKVTIWILNFRNEFDCSGVQKTRHMYNNPNPMRTSDFYRKTILILQVCIDLKYSKQESIYISLFVYHLYQGVDLMERFNYIVNAITNLHVHIKCPITKQSILHVCKLIELIKFIKLTMEKYSTEIYQTTLCLSQHQLYQALHIISNVRVSQPSHYFFTFCGRVMKAIHFIGIFSL